MQELNSSQVCSPELLCAAAMPSKDTLKIFIDFDFLHLSLVDGVDELFPSPWYPHPAKSTRVPIKPRGLPPLRKHLDGHPRPSPIIHRSSRDITAIHDKTSDL